MANQEQLKILLEEGVEAWNKWREDNPDVKGVQIDFSGADLSRINLNRVDFRGAYLEKVNLEGANLSEAYLEKANLTLANLKRVNLSGAYLDNAFLSRANLDKANLKEADLIGIQTLGTNFGNAILTGAFIKDWEINSETSFENVVCEYIFFKPHQQERRPLDINRKFDNGEFVNLVYKYIRRREIPSFIGVMGSIVSASDFYKQIKKNQIILYENFIVSDRNYKNNSTLLQGVFLYTEEDISLAHYIRENYRALDKLTGRWCNLYVFEKPCPSLQSLKKYWIAILSAKLYEEWNSYK